MSNINDLSLHAFVNAQTRLVRSDERGSQTAEYGVTILVAVALALSVFGLVSGGAFNEIISKLIKAVLKQATSLVGS